MMWVFNVRTRFQLSTDVKMKVIEQNMQPVQWLKGHQSSGPIFFKFVPNIGQLWGSFTYRFKGTDFFKHFTKDVGPFTW
jgi:hypothetical protein